MNGTGKVGTALVLGITGGIGGAVAKALAGRGWTIRALTRRKPEARPAMAFPVDWREGDSLDRDAVVAAADGVSIIVHAVNPPGYARWREDGLPMLQNTIEAARQCGATIVFPANVYVFSSQSPEMVDQRTPKSPQTRKGQVRLEMEQMLEAASREDVRTIAVRAGDFFGPGAQSSWFTQALAKGGKEAKVLRSLTSVGHAWAFVPDVAETFVRLVARRDTLAPFELVHFAGHYDATGRELAEAVRRAAGRPDLPIKPFRWIQVWLGAPFMPFLRETLEMLWLWKHPLRLDNSKLVALLGAEPHTPLDEAVGVAINAKD